MSFPSLIPGPHRWLSDAHHHVHRPGPDAGNLWRRSSFKNHPRSRGWKTWRRSRLAEISGWGARFRKAISGCIQKEWFMRIQPLMLGALGALALSACSQQEEIAAAPPPPPPPGAVPGSIAADRDGDGIIDGYYTADGVYHPNYMPPPPPPPPAPTQVGERSDEHKSELQSLMR